MEDVDEGIRELRGKGRRGKGRGRSLEVVRSQCVGVRDKGWRAVQRAKAGEWAMAWGPG